jgi:arabinogalactan oligomer/maltooligosaccharide transport system permease protein
MANATAVTEKPLIIKKKRRTPLKWFLTTGWRHLVGLALILYAIFPILYILSTSLYPNNSIEGTNTLFAAISFQNYINLFSDPARPFGLWYINTVVIGITTSVLSVFISALAAYAFSRLRFRGRRGGLLSLILIQMFPSLLGLVAIFGMLTEIGKIFPAFGLDSVLGLVMIYLGGSLGGGTYLMYGFFNTVPKELDEAAKLDGATHTQVFYGIILRLVSPVLAVQMLLTYIGITSDYVLASVVLSKPESLTLAVGLQQFISDPFSKDWSMFTAGAVLAAVPVVTLFMFLQRYIVSGLLGGAVKG